MGKVLRYILNHKKRMLKSLLVILGVAILIICSASHYVLIIYDGVFDKDKTANVPSTIRNYIDESALYGYADDEVDLKTKKSKSGGYALDIDLNELVDNIIKELDKYEGRLSIYLSKDKINEYLKKMIEVEYITQYPDLRQRDKIGTEVPDGEFQGVIQFNRHKGDGTEELLEYIPLGDENVANGSTLYGLINQANGKAGVSDKDIQSARDKVLKCFSVDVHGNLIVANWSETIKKTVSGSYATEYPGRTEKVDYSEKDRENLSNATEETSYEYFAHVINYKSSISKYTMPFNYLWAFLVCGNDEEFISNFANLVLDSKIVISIYDNLTEIQETTIDAYNDILWKQIRTSTRTTVDGNVTSSSDGAWNSPQIDSSTHKYDINYIRTYSNAIVIAVTDLDIWFMDYSVQYTYEVEDDGEEKEIEYLEPIDNNKVTEEGTWETISTTSESVTDSEGNVTGTQDKKKQEKTDVITQHVFTQRTFTNIYRTIQYKYTLDGAAEVKEKTDPKLKEGDEGYPNFCTLYLESESAKANITDAEEWLFTIIEKNSDTVNMLELTKYMLYCATGVNLGVTVFDFGKLYPTNMVEGLYGDTIEAQIWFALLDAGYSKESAAGVLGNLQQESGIRTNNLQNSYEHILGMNDEQYTEAVDSGTYTNFSNDKAGYGIAQWTSAGRKEGLYKFAKTIKDVSISDASVQILYLLGEISQSGGADGCATFQMGGNYQGFSYSSWSNAKTPEDAAVAFCKVFERAGNESLTNRKNYARDFYEKYKDATKDSIYIGNIELTEENKQKMLNMLNDAVRIANDDRYGYSQDRRDEEFYYDCSSLVYRLYKKHFNINVPNTTATYPNYNQYRVNGPAANVQLKPGDILWRRKGKEGHVTIYIGNGNYVAAHSAKKPKASQITVYQDNPSNYMYVYRFVGK